MLVGYKLLLQEVLSDYQDQTCGWGAGWWLMSVYGPVADAEKLEFLEELQTVGGALQGPWLVMGHFSMIYRAQDKNNNRLNRRLMGQF
jgi:hypothetical protein